MVPDLMQQRHHRTFLELVLPRIEPDRMNVVALVPAFAEPPSQGFFRQVGVAAKVAPQLPEETGFAGTPGSLYADHIRRATFEDTVPELLRKRMVPKRVFVDRLIVWIPPWGQNNRVAHQFVSNRNQIGAFLL